MRRLILSAAILGATVAISPAANAQKHPKKPLPPAKAAIAPLSADGIKRNATPPLWRINGAHGVVYLFGGVTFLRPDVHWKTQKLRDAFSQCHTLYVGSADIDQDAEDEASRLLARFGTDEIHPLSTKITQHDIDLFDAAAAKAHLGSEQRFEQMEPWYADLMLGVLPPVRSGYSTSLSVNKVLYNDAKASGKAVKGFYTDEETVRRLAGVPLDEQISHLRADLQDLIEGNDEIAEVVGPWSRGDVSTLAALDSPSTRLPRYYNQMTLIPNHHVTTAIRAMLQSSSAGGVFVSLGITSFVGPDGIIKMLETDGVHVERIQ